MHDSNGEGRIATAIDSRNLFSAELDYCTNVSIFISLLCLSLFSFFFTSFFFFEYIEVLFSEGDSTSTGSVAWAGLALARAYHYITNKSSS